MNLVQEICAFAMSEPFLAFPQFLPFWLPCFHCCIIYCAIYNLVEILLNEGEILMLPYLFSVIVQSDWHYKLQSTESASSSQDTTSTSDPPADLCLCIVIILDTLKKDQVEQNSLCKMICFINLIM